MNRREFTFKAIHSEGHITANVFFIFDDKKASKPLAILYHGGAFTVGSKEMIPQTQIQKLVVDWGWIVVAPDYRLCPTISLYEGPITDALDAYNWSILSLPDILRKEGVGNVDTQRVMSGGYSAGGTLALLTARGVQPPSVIVDFYGSKYLTDEQFFSPLPSLANLPTFDEKFLAKVFEEDAPTSSALSLEDPKTEGFQGPTKSTQPPGLPPIDFSVPRNAWLFDSLKRGTLFQNIVPDKDFNRVEPTNGFSENFPPTIFVHGTADQSVDVSLTIRAHQDLKEKGGRGHLFLVDGADHGFDSSLKPGDKAFESVLAALELAKGYVEN
ncbi:unnamed protein product [Clonostachys rosea]|uniref:Alpha/beta hydrolase fold-3 domain-containing protein n=1 Tax=Bionectria ochroleuca TaxID=29856 RepID=A0ABY6TWR5_BIOOC|nr:unnamed protein product [Clonostachys rosea]